MLKKLLPPHWFLVCLLAMGACRMLIPDANLVPVPWNLAGIAFLAPGVWLLVAGSSLFARVQTNINPLNDPDRLVTTGPFAFSRNPMYLGFLFVLFGVATLLANAAAYVFLVVFFLVIRLRFIPMEERACESALGDAYLAYKARVRRWL